MPVAGKGLFLLTTPLACHLYVLRAGAGGPFTPDVQEAFRSLLFPQDDPSPPYLHPYDDSALASALQEKVRKRNQTLLSWPSTHTLTLSLLRYSHPPRCTLRRP